jgi:outer membrane protein assembly factor BamA
LAKAERRLLDLPGIASARITPSSANPAMVIVDIDRAPWARASYDLHYDAANKLGGLVDAELGEIGRLGTVGGRYRVGSDVRELRGSLHSTLLGGKGLTGSVFRLTEDLSPSPALTQNVQTGVEIQHAFRLPDRWSLLAGYRFKRVTVTSFTPVDLGALEMSLMRESRDNPLDATRGRFLSLNMELSHPRLASTASFFKGFGQAFFARSLHPRLVWAQGFRLGLAHVFPGGPLLSFERFRAGGPNSVRGFATDAIGPRGYFDNPIGGQAVFVVNQELRYRHRTGLGVAGFYDLGNIFTTVRDIRLSARHSLGAGLRFSSPIGLVRFDLAWPLAPQLGESRSRRMFSIGQAF